MSVTFGLDFLWWSRVRDVVEEERSSVERVKLRQKFGFLVGLDDELRVQR